MVVRLKIVGRFVNMFLGIISAHPRAQTGFFPLF